MYLIALIILSMGQVLLAGEPGARYRCCWPFMRTRKIPIARVVPIYEAIMVPIERDNRLIHAEHQMLMSTAAAIQDPVERNRAFLITSHLFGNQFRHLPF